MHDPRTLDLIFTGLVAVAALAAGLKQRGIG